MSEVNRLPSPRLPQDPLRLLLERVLGEDRRIVCIEYCGPHDYQSTHPLQELRIDLTDGARMMLVAKFFPDADPSTTSPSPNDAIYHPLREIAVYRDILPRARLSTARYVGHLTDSASKGQWLILGKVPATVLYEIGQIEVWQEAARTLARLHSSLSGLADNFADDEAIPLLQFHRQYFASWLPRAQSLFEQAGNACGGKILREIQQNYQLIVDRLCRIKQTIIHGEFYASNILVQDEASIPEICPIDWEMTGLGPPLLDLAALTSGKWTPQQRNLIVAAYQDEAASLGLSDDGEFAKNLLCCRLLISLQWLGWRERWVPPAHQAHDWLSEADSAYRKIVVGM